MSSAKITRGSWRYYVDQEPCRAADYYLGHDQDPGVWLGRGLEVLGIEPGSVVSERQLEALFGRALHPDTGRQLGRAWRSDGVTGYDLTFSAPKSVSALVAAADDGFGPALPGTRGPDTATKSLAARDVEAEAAEAATRASRLAEAQGRLLAGLQSVAGMSSGGIAGPSAATGTVGSSSAGVRELVVAAHDTATQTALSYLDTHASLSRRGTDGIEQVDTAGLTVAAFTHYTSREGDPQLHTHALVLNKVQCADGSWRTLDGHEMFAHKKSAGMIYQAVLRNELAASLGIQFGEVSKVGQGEILGIPESLLEQWSKRTHAVNREAANAVAELETKLGRTLSTDERAAVTKTAVLKTRPDKTHEDSLSLSARWVAEAAALGIELHALLPAAQRAALLAGQPVRVLSGAELAAAALTAAGRSRAVFSRADVAGHVAALLPTTGMRAAEVLATVEQLSDQALTLGEAVSVGAPVHGATHRRSDPRYATVEILHAEHRILTLARTGDRAGAGQVGYDQIRHVLAAVRSSGVELDRSQVEAVLHLTSRGDTLDVLTAPAGAGKTATLGTCAQAWHAAGYRVIGLAPSARAAAELGTAITNTGGSSSAAAGGVGSRTDTLAKWLHTRANQPGLDQQAAGTAGRAAWARLDTRTVLVVDEASMASTLDLDQLTHAAAQAGAKVVLVGDPAQIGVINGPGGMLATLAQHGHGIALTRIHRFSHEWEKHASLALRDGDNDALQPYLAQQRLHPCVNGDSAADQLFGHWQHASSQGLDALMLARTRVDVEALNMRARDAALTAGQLSGPVSSLGGRDWQSGDLLRTRKNQRQLPVGDGHVRNGDRYRVFGPAPDGGLFVEDLSGRGRTTLPGAYVAKHVEYGWAATIDGAQGATADLGLLLVRPGLDREHLYVGMTRGRHGNHAYLSPDPTLNPDQHTPAHPGRPRDQAELQAACLEVLQTALAVSGAQDSATTALARARDAERQRDARQPHDDNTPDRPTRTESRAVREPERRPEPASNELAARRAKLAQRLAQLEQQHATLRATRTEIYGQRRLLTGELSGLPRWAVGRRRQLTRDVATLDEQAHGLTPQLAALDQDLQAGRELARQLAREARTNLAARASKTPLSTSTARPDQLAGWAAAAARGQRPSGTRDVAAPPADAASLRRRPDRGPSRRGLGRPDLHEPPTRDRDFGPDLGR